MTIDQTLIAFARRNSIFISRIALFIVFFWFGALKLFDLSPANPLVASLLEQTIPFMTFGTFIILLGIVEMIIGILFLIKGTERIAILLLVLHMITTIMPLFFLPEIAWQGPMIPTLEGQYIIKNVLIIAIAIVIGARLAPIKG